MCVNAVFMHTVIMYWNKGSTQSSPIWDSGAWFMIVTHKTNQGASVDTLGWKVGVRNYFKFWELLFALCRPLSTGIQIIWFCFIILTPNKMKQVLSYHLGNCLLLLTGCLFQLGSLSRIIGFLLGVCPFGQSIWINTWISSLHDRHNVL